MEKVVLRVSPWQLLRRQPKKCCKSFSLSQVYTPTPAPCSQMALMINNLGGTSNLELLVFVRDVLRQLTSSFQIEVTRLCVGTMMTSISMAGVSLSLLRLTDENQSLLQVAQQDVCQWLDAPTDGYWPAYTSPPTPTPTLMSPAPVISTDAKPETMNFKFSAQAQLIAAAISACCRVLQSMKQTLTELDMACGDGDCGVSMSNGAAAILAALDSTIDPTTEQPNLPCLALDHPAELSLQMASIIEHNMGGTSGVLYSIFFSAASTAFPELNTDIKDVTCEMWAKALDAGVQAIQYYGGATLGSRTMLDVLLPISTQILRIKGYFRCHQTCL
eukprot:m.182641 g.182641  ORF g.182641 m.182641 type:complete len:331 (+) comp14673_c0_seq11:1047-2039(+)